jgi:DUF1707 SHOCT-like domain
MASDPRIRASDADRDHAAQALREHHAAGRISIDEFQERLDRVYAAKTLGELGEVMADLPAIDLYQLPIPADQRFVPPHPPAARSQGRMSPAWRGAWASWASVSLLCVVIWLIAGGISSGGTAYFWPIWVAGPMGAILLARWVFGASPGGGHGPASGGGRDQRRAQRRDTRDEIRAHRRDMRDEWRSRRRDLRDPPSGRSGDR